MKVDVAQGERRQITVLFADMAGYTAVSERLGEEGAYELIQPIYAIMADAVRELAGTVQDFTGDGIMALFGVPAALEDAPLRGCRASLLIQQRLAEAMPAMELRFGFRPQMRIGINSGPAVVGRVGAGGEARVTAIGDTVNLASRLQSLAEPGTVLLSEAANQLVQGLVASEFLGEFSIKGKSEAQRVYRLIGVTEGADPESFGASVRRGLTAFVGRDQELARLEGCAQDALSGMHVVDIVGEPGIGKSRLLYEFRQRIDRKQFSLLSSDCSPDGRQTAFLPFIEVVRSSFQIQAGTNKADAARQLESGLTALALDSEEIRGLLLNLPWTPDAQWGIDRPRRGHDRSAHARFAAQAVDGALQTEACRAPDRGSALDRQCLRGPFGQERGARETVAARDCLLPQARISASLVASGRTTIALAPLSTQATSDIVQSRLGEDMSTPALLELIVDRADGNALFAEEIAGYLKERLSGQGAPGGDFDLAAVAAVMPASIQALLTARVDALDAPDREMLQAAAVIGRRFGPDLLAAVATRDAEQRLIPMQALDFVQRDQATGEFVFKHALVRDALYEPAGASARRSASADRRGTRNPHGNSLPNSPQALRTTTLRRHAPPRRSHTRPWRPSRISGLFAGGGGRAMQDGPFPPRAGRHLRRQCRPHRPARRLRLHPAASV